MNKKEILRSILARFDEKELSGVAEQINEAYVETIEHCRPLFTRENSICAMVGIVIAFSQIKQQTEEQCKNMNIPLFEEMVDLFGEGFVLGSVAYETTAEEDSDE